MKVVLSGGGTGGHIYPALALRQEILNKYPNAQFLYIGTEKGLEQQIVTQLNIPFQAIKVQGLKRQLSFENIKTVYYALKSILKAKKILKSFQPDVVIGTGGYVCGPVLYAASKLNIPTIIHEQNSVAGITNKLLAKHVTKICTSFETVNRDFKTYEHKIVFTGNPRGQEIVHTEYDANVLQTMQLTPNVPTVLIFGGSRGAENLNRSIIANANCLKEMPCQFIFVTGQVHYETVKSQLIESDRFKIVPYLNNMIDVLHSVDLVVCRSGATTLAEITALGIASVLIPSPYVTENHQEKNARALVDKQAADIVLERELDGEKLYHIIYDIMMNGSRRQMMGQAAKKMGITDASHRIINVIEQMINSSR